MKPINVQPHTTSTTPATKKILPLKFLCLRKNLNADCMPRMTETPARNKTFPMARRPLSKKNKTPMKSSKDPNPVKATPISVKNTKHGYHKREQGNCVTTTCL